MEKAFKMKYNILNGNMKMFMIIKAGNLWSLNFMVFGIIIRFRG